LPPGQDSVEPIQAQASVAGANVCRHTIRGDAEVMPEQSVRPRSIALIRMIGTFSSRNIHPVLSVVQVLNSGFPTTPSCMAPTRIHLCLMAVTQPV